MSLRVLGYACLFLLMAFGLYLRLRRASLSFVSHLTIYEPL